jgi:hypothetical protein
MGMEKAKHPPGFYGCKSGIPNFAMPDFVGCHKDPFWAFYEPSLERVQRSVDVNGDNHPFPGYPPQFVQDITAFFAGLHVL